jgi:hypothetical protein
MNEEGEDEGGPRPEERFQPVFDDILNQPGSVEIAPSELGQPLSLDEGGGISTVRDWIIQRAPEKVREEFSSVAELYS